MSNGLSGAQKWFGNLVKYVENGKGKILGRFYGVVTFVLVASTYLVVSGEQISIYEVVWYSFLFLVFLTFLGWIYSKLGLLEAETSALNQESPELMEIHKDVKEIKAIIKGF